jgi:hypothetical protein
LRQTSSAVLSKLEEQHKAIDMMKENFSAIPEEMLQMSDRFATAINLVSDMAASSTEAQQRILDGVDNNNNNNNLSFCMQP